MNNPTKPTLKTEIIPLLTIAASVLFGWYFYARFPETVATHWSYYGQPDGYSSKAVAAWGLPLLLTGLYLLFLALPVLDPRRERYGDFAKTYHLFKASILLILLAIFVAAGFANLGYAVKINYLVPLAVGLLFMVLGNYMGKLKKNWFLGIRTPWTLASENVWNQTHRVGGKLMALCGLFIMATPLLPQSYGLPLFFIAVIGFALGTITYSYYLYRKEQKEAGQQQIR